MGKHMIQELLLGAMGKLILEIMGKIIKIWEKNVQFVALLGIFEKAARIVYFQHAKRPHFTNLVSEIRKLFIQYFRRIKK